jgi:mannan endo-1,4-beta-mannosidase
MLSRPQGTASTIGLALVVAALLLLATIIAYGIVTPASPGAPDSHDEAEAGERPGAESDFVYREGAEFMLRGEPFYYAGTNAYTLMFESPAGVDMHMVTAQESNMTVLRAWGFFDTGTPEGDLTVEGNQRGIYFQYWDEEAGKPAFNDGPNGLERLDYMIYSAGQHDIKLVLPLVNNWTAFGGVDQYVRWAGGTWHDDFFRDEQIKGWYKDWVSHVLNRVNPLTGIAYKDDPAIMAWELGNELRCSESGPYLSSQQCGSQLFVDWAAEMSDYVRSIDNNHLIGFGGEGFLCTEPGGPSTLTNCAESGDPVKITALPNIDMNGIHVYPNHWQPTEPTDDWEEWGIWWLEQHGAIANEANKPYFIGEYGWLDVHSRTLVYDRWLKAFHDAGGDGSHFWVMQPAASIAQPPDGVGFTQRCPGTACDLVSAWSQHVRDGMPWEEFAPVADHDQTHIAAGGVAMLDPLANDKVFGTNTWDLDTLDIDPTIAGVQSERVTDRGTFRVVNGMIEFTHDAESTGTARTAYTIADSAGRVSGEATIAIIIDAAS